MDNLLGWSNAGADEAASNPSLHNAGSSVNVANTRHRRWPACLSLSERRPNSEPLCPSCRPAQPNPWTIPSLKPSTQNLWWSHREGTDGKLRRAISVHWTDDLQRQHQLVDFWARLSVSCKLQVPGPTSRVKPNHGFGSIDPRPQSPCRPDRHQHLDHDQPPSGQRPRASSQPIHVTLDLESSPRGGTGTSFLCQGQKPTQPKSIMMTPLGCLPEMRMLTAWHQTRLCPRAAWTKSPKYSEPSRCSSLQLGSIAVIAQERTHG
jgi:hypothetical protein